MHNGDPYKYDDVNVLKNKWGIKDGEILERLERDITVRRIADMDNVIQGDFDYQRLLAIHKYIFGDIFEWVGLTRTIRMTKSEAVLGGDTVRYSQPKNIEKETKEAIEKLNSVKWETLNISEKALEFSKRIAELWQVRPFREGNTRTVVTYGIQFANEHGLPINKILLQEHSSKVRNALVKASDGQYSDYHYLANIFLDAMQIEPRKKKENPKSVLKENEYER